MMTAQRTILSPWWSTIIPGGFYAVDVFFFLSGFLTFHLLTEKIYGKPFNIRFFTMIFVHRYLRLLFVMIFVMLFAMYCFYYMGSGPQWDLFEDFMIKEQC